MLSFDFRSYRIKIPSLEIWHRLLGLMRGSMLTSKSIQIRVSVSSRRPEKDVDLSSEQSPIPKPQGRVLQRHLGCDQLEDGGEAV